MSAIQLAVLALVSLLLGLFVVRPLLMQKRGVDAMGLQGSGAAALPAPSDAPMSLGLNGEIDDGFDLPSMPVVNFDDSAMFGGPPSDPVSRLRKLIDERQTESIEILRNWMEKEEERS